MIKPTIGRVVWYWKNAEVQQTEGAQPCAALVTYIHSDELVNLATFDRNGDTYPVVGVPLYQGEGERPSGKHCEWMPYQKGQAAKVESGIDTASLIKRLAELEAKVAALSPQPQPQPQPLPKSGGDIQVQAAASPTAATKK